MIADAKTRYGLPIRILTAEMGLCPATLRRWRRRINRGQAAVGRRGPRKVKPLNLGELKERIEGLRHGRKRSRDSGSLHRAYGAAISRRDLDAMVRAVRSETSRQRRVEMYHVCWLRPNLAWAMDDCEKTENGADGTLHLHNLTDLHSRYRLPPLASHCLPCGEEVAGHLQYLFDRFEPPLFCKRDNGGNLNHLAVNQVLEEALVIPINSPPYRAPYNGGIEHTQGEFKSYLDRWSWKAGTVGRMALLSETAAHDLNHQPRRCLGGKTACRAYFGGPRIRYPRRKRAAAYGWIQDLAAELSTRAGKSVITPTAWRIAARQWLVKNGLIRIQKAGEVSPNFCQKSDHN
jgi:transposase-like protein